MPLMHTDAIAHLKQADPILANLIEQLGECQLGQNPTTDTTLSALGRAIIYQRISIKAANTVYMRFLQLYGNPAFPSALEILNTPDATLASIGLGRFKVAYLKDLAQKVLEGLPDLTDLQAMKDEEIIKTLTQVKGIGRWSVQMVLIFQLHRWDIWPTEDLGLQLAVRDLYQLETLPKKKVMEALGAKWQPYRTIASWYLWRSRDLTNADLLDIWG